MCEENHNISSIIGVFDLETTHFLTESLHHRGTRSIKDCTE